MISYAVSLFSLNIFILVLVILGSYQLFAWIFLKKKSLFLIIIFCLIFIFQFSTTKRESLTLLSNDQIRIRDMRLAEYPPVVIKIGNWSRWIPVAYWFEGRPEFTAISRIGQNFAQIIDPNFYFFSNHPRERIGFQETPKYPYIFLPFFIWGALKFFEETSKRVVIIVFLVPIFVVSLIGLNNLYGPFSLFPFISVAIALGMLDAIKYLQNYAKRIKK